MARGPTAGTPAITKMGVPIPQSPSLRLRSKEWFERSSGRTTALFKPFLTVRKTFSDRWGPVGRL